ncbi:MAG: hypothetical protein GY928_18710 [Colwellia sp.]|nr:hypothetical protein [Colwellia sp.]
MTSNLIKLITNRKTLIFLFFSYFCNSTFAGLFSINDSIDIGSLVLTESFVSYYSYGSPDGASANTGYEEEGNAIMFLAEHNYELALFTIIDKPGGSHSTRYTEMAISGFNNADVIFVDDTGETNSAGFKWRWASCCTDGMIYKITDESDFNIDIEFDGIVGLNDLKFLSFDPDGTLSEVNILDTAFSIQNKITSVPEPSLFSLLILALLNYFFISFSAKKVN